MKCFNHIIEHWACQTGIHADPKNLIHDEVCVFQRADHSVWYVSIGRLADEVTSEEQAGGYLMAFKEAHYLVAGKGRFKAQGDGKAEPTGLAIGCRFR